MDKIYTQQFENKTKPFRGFKKVQTIEETKKRQEVVYNGLFRELILEEAIKSISKKTWNKLHQKIQKFYKEINKEETLPIMIDLSEMGFERGNKSSNIKFLLMQRLKRTSKFLNRFDY